jgi:hypothetical protein
LIRNLEMNVRFRDDDTYPFIYRKSGTEWAFYDEQGTIVKKQAHTKKELEKYLNKELAGLVKAIKKISKEDLKSI